MTQRQSVVAKERRVGSNFQTPFKKCFHGKCPKHLIPCFFYNVWHSRDVVGLTNDHHMHKDLQNLVLFGKAPSEKNKWLSYCSKFCDWSQLNVQLYVHSAERKWSPKIMGQPTFITGFVSCWLSQLKTINYRNFFKETNQKQWPNLYQRRKIHQDAPSVR